MEKTLKTEKHLQILFVLCTVMMLSFSASFGIYSEVSNVVAVAPAIENSVDASAESQEESALSGEVAFAKAVIDIIKKGLATRL